MPPKQARRTPPAAPGGSTSGAAKPSGAPRSGPPRILCAADVRLGGIAEGLPPLSGEAAEVAAGASRRQWELLLDAAAGTDAFVLLGRLLDPAADLRAERALRQGLDRLSAADVAVFAVTAEPLPDDLPLTVLAPDEPGEIELARGDEPLAVLRTLAGAATFPVPDGLPVLGVTFEPDADADGCDVLFSSSSPGEAPGTLFVLPETAGAGGAASEPWGERPVRFFVPVLDLPDEPHDLAARLREAAPPRAEGERLRIVDWTLRLGPWGDRLTESDADALAAALSDARAVHSVALLPHPDRFADDADDGDETGEAAAFLEALAHFDPLGDATPLPGVAPNPDRVRELATRFAAPLLSAG